MCPAAASSSGRGPRVVCGNSRERPAGPAQPRSSEGRHPPSRRMKTCRRDDSPAALDPLLHRVVIGVQVQDDNVASPGGKHARDSRLRPTRPEPEIPFLKRRRVWAGVCDLQNTVRSGSSVGDLLGTYRRIADGDTRSLWDGSPSIVDGITVRGGGRRILSLRGCSPGGSGLKPRFFVE